METTSAAHTRALFNVAVELEIPGEIGAQPPRKWTAMSPTGTHSAVRTSTAQLRVVRHNQVHQQQSEEDTSIDIELASEIVDFAFSGCGEFLAVADAGGALHLVKSQSGRALFAYPIIAPSALASDSIQVVVFATRSAPTASQDPSPEDLLVLTRSGVLIRLGNLRLDAIEQTLANAASHNAALRTIMASIQLQQVIVGAQNGGARSILLARRYSSSLFVTIANHEHVLSVWRADTSGRQKDASIKRQATYEALMDGTAVRDAQLILSDRYLAVLSDAGSVSWWDWRGLVMLSELNFPSVNHFAVVDSPAVDYSNAVAETSCVVALCSRDQPKQIQKVRVQLTSTTRGVDIIAISVDENVATSIIALAAARVTGRNDNVLITQRTSDTVMAVVLDIHGADSDKDETLPCHGDPHGISAGVRCGQELRALDFSAFADPRVVADFEDKLKTWLCAIGQDLEDSRLIVESLINFAKRLRIAHASENSLPANVLPNVISWLEQVELLSYRWTTFTLLLSTVSGSGENAHALVTRWREFCKANLLETMCHYLKRGTMRAVSLLWHRHTHDEALQNINLILDSIPQNLPFATYEKWLQNDVVPGILKLGDQQVDHASRSVAGTIQIFASWVIIGIHYYAEKDDIDTALRLCRLLRPSEKADCTGPSSDASLRWLSLRLLNSASHEVTEQTKSGCALDQIEHISQQLEHMKHLEAQHGFKISLSVFSQETPVTIAMSMLDRCTSAEGVPIEIHQHVTPYLSYCGQVCDPVILEYITEVIESSPTTSSTSEQARLIAIMDEILDVEIRASAALQFFGSLLPPFSQQVKQFTAKCVTWDTQLIDAIQENVRLMEIQDMLTSYGVARFQVGDARSGSRLVSHILSQIIRDSAFVDALQLVRAYTHLSVERAALEYFENLLTIELATTSVSVDLEVIRRSNLVKSVVRQLKNHFSSQGEMWKIASVVDETVALGLSLLEMKESEDERKSVKAPSRATAHADGGLLSFLEAIVDVFTSDLASLVGTDDDDGVGGLGECSVYLNSGLVSDLQRVRRMYNEWGVLVSVKTIRSPELVSERVKASILPDAMFTGHEASQRSTKPSHQYAAGKGKKRALGAMTTSDDGGPNKKGKSTKAFNPLRHGDDEQQDDRKTKLAFDLHRFATHMGMGGDDYHSLVAQSAAEHGDILKAVQYSRDLFSRRRGVLSANSTATPSISGLALKNISLSISKYTAVHTEDIYTLANQAQQVLTPIQLARMHAPLYSLELLQYAICFCDADSFEETFLLLKTAMLSNDILKFTQLGSFNGAKSQEEESMRIYGRWFREHTLCVLPSAQTMNLATRFAVAEHRLLIEHGENVPVGITDSTTAISSQDFVASKRFVTFLVENNADLLSLQVILSMRWIPEDALNVVQTQISKLTSTVFQSRKIDSFLALGLMLTMDERDAFNAFRRQLSRENVAKDFDRFQQLAKIGSDSARAWQKIAFLNQCMELEANARWWHFLNLLEIECDHKAFRSEHRDLNYIRALVPTLLAKSSYDYYTIQEFTRHYQIDDSFPALVYVEALLTASEASSSNGLEYQDKIVGVLEDIHEQKLIALLLKTLPNIPGTDYDRLLFMFQLLLEHTSYSDKDEIERRIEVLQVLKVFESSSRGTTGPVVSSLGETTENKSNEKGATTGTSKRGAVCFHRVISKPREVLSEILTTRSFGVLSNLVLPLRLEPDELLMLLLKNVVSARRTGATSKTSGKTESTKALSGSELERLFSILSSLNAAESKTTAGEWLAEHLPISTHKLRALEFALQAAAASSSASPSAASDAGPSTSTFVGIEALTRLDQKVLRVKIQLIFADSHISRFVDATRQANLLKFLPNQPKELFYELYHLVDTSSPGSSYNRALQDDSSLHKIADRIAVALNLNASELRADLVRELLIKDAVCGTSRKRQDDRRGTAGPEEDIFTPLEHEQRDARDEELINKISSISSIIAQDNCLADHPAVAIALVEYLVTFARDTKPRAGVTFRAKLRAARTVLYLAQSHQSVVIAAVETKMKLSKFELVIKELVDYIRHCKHMIIFEEHRIPYEIGFVMRSKKEALVRSLLRQHSGNEAWVLRCVANVMLDFGVYAPDLWMFVLKTMMQCKMFRSLSRVLNGLSQHAFVRSIEGANEVWESTLLSPLLELKALDRDRDRDQATSMEVDDEDLQSSDDERLAGDFRGVPLTHVRSELELMVTMLQKCPFLDQIDVPSFVLHLRDLTVGKAGAQLAKIDIFAYAVRCAMVIPRPSARLQALQRIIQSGAYMQVLGQVCDASTLADEPFETEASGELDKDEVAEQFAILETVFKEAVTREEHEKLIGSSFEPAFLEFLAVSGTVDRALSLLLSKKRLEAASTLVELYYESNPERAPSDWAVIEPGSENQGRWNFLQRYVAGSTSPHLAAYRRGSDS